MYHCSISSKRGQLWWSEIVPFIDCWWAPARYQIYSWATTMILHTVWKFQSQSPWGLHNIEFCIAGPLCGESIGNQWFSALGTSVAELSWFLCCFPVKAFVDNHWNDQWNWIPYGSCPIPETKYMHSTRPNVSLISWIIPCSVLILASDWLTTVKYGAVSHVWRHQCEI